MSSRILRRHDQRLHGGAWRWKRASLIASRDRYPSLHREDQIVRALVDVLGHDINGMDIDHLNPAWLLAFREAQAIYEDQAKRLTMDALILVGEGARGVSRHTGVALATVAEYERCFFHVHALLGAKDFIFTFVIDRDDDDDILRRLVLRHAYLGGTVAAEYWLSNLEHVGKGIEHDVSTDEGRERERLELLLLQGSIDFDQVPANRMEELVLQCKPVQALPTVSDLMQSQVDRVIADQPNAVETAPAAYLAPYRSPASLQSVVA